MFVLSSKSQIRLARRELERRKLSSTSSQAVKLIYRIAYKFKIARTIAIGDNVKSWDVLRTTNFVEQHLSQQAWILDIGTYASEIPEVFRRLKYSNVVGVDLNANLGDMPNKNSTRFIRANFMATPFRSTQFSVITAVSVIEHGFNGPALLAEVSRLLESGGYFIASFDYWPEKIDTTGIDIFGMSWQIFSRQEVLDFVKDAEAFGLIPANELNLDTQQPVMHWGGKDYTFAWLVLQKL